MSLEEAGALAAGHTKLLGATFDRKREGTNFAFYAGKDATGVDLCLFDKPHGPADEKRFALTAKEEVRGDNGNVIGYIWNGFAPGVKAGALYGFRVQGEYNPDNGLYFNHTKLLIDPAAKAVTGELHDWNVRHFHYSAEDNADIVPKARVVDTDALYYSASRPLPAYPGVSPLGSLYTHADTNTLEMHVRGGTWDHPEIPEAERGKFAGLVHPEFIRFLKKEDYTGIELMPTESFGTDVPTAARGKEVYSGYQPMAPASPHTGYALTSRPEREYMHTLRTLKENGIEVIMDVVPNHTLEGDRSGPLLHLRGMDDKLYYYSPDGKDWTGAGNTRDFGHPINIRLFVEELKHWKKMGVAAFRIDLGGIIGRVHGGDFDPDSPMMRAIHEDPELRDVKISVEPYDLGRNGQQLSRLASVRPEQEGKVNIPSEWDPRYRDTMRAVAFNNAWDLPRHQIIEQLVGEEHIYKDPMRRVAKFGSHDRETRADGVSAESGKNNWWHGENNLDGNPINPEHYWASMADRLRVQRFADGLLAITQGPILSELGDDRQHSQIYDSNLWCLDKDPASPNNLRAHIPWGKAITKEGQELMQFKGMANRFRTRHTSLRRGTLFTGMPDGGSQLSFGGGAMKDVTWLEPDGREIGPGGTQSTNGFAMMLSGDPGNTPPTETNPTRIVHHERDQPLLVLLNTTRHDMEFTLPEVQGVQWRAALNTLAPSEVGKKLPEAGKVKVSYKSLVVFEGHRELLKDMAQPGQKTGPRPRHVDFIHKSPDNGEVPISR